MGAAPGSRPAVALSYRLRGFGEDDLHYQLLLGTHDKMVTGLVQNLGREANDGRRTFPSPEAMALMPLKFYVNEVRSGYRAAYLKELAERVAAGSLEVEKWLTSPLTTAELIKEMKTVKGVGDYAAENVLKLLGRYDGLALDSWTRASF